MRLTRTLATVSAALLLFGMGTAAAASYKIDPSHSSVGFKIRHLVGRVPGTFGQFSGNLEMDPADMSKGSVQVTIQAASIDTGNSDRDEHLRNADFFDVEKYPEITFQSQKVTGSGDSLQVEGMLTMHGVSKPVTLDVEVLGVAPDPWGNTRAGFEATTTINRKDFGISWNRALDAGGFILGEDVDIVLTIEAVEQKDEAAASGGGR